MNDEFRVAVVPQTEAERELEIENSKVSLALQKLELEKQRYEFEVSKLSEEFDVFSLKTARLCDSVDEFSVAKARTQLYALSMTNPPDSHLFLDINSPGGSVSDGMELYGIVRELSDLGFTMYTRISGQACSMGGVISQAGDVRQIRQGSYLHLHEASWASWGKASEMMESAEYVERVSHDIAHIYAERSTMTAEAIYDRMHRREWWLSAKEALEIGFVDEIV